MTERFAKPPPEIYALAPKGKYSTTAEVLTDERLSCLLLASFDGFCTAGFDFGQAGPSDIFQASHRWPAAFHTELSACSRN